MSVSVSGPDILVVSELTRCIIRLGNQIWHFQGSGRISDLGERPDSDFSSVNCSEIPMEMAPSAPRTRAVAALRMKQIALDNQGRMIRCLRAQLAGERRGLATMKKELEDTQVALEASHKVITGLTEIGLSMSKKIEKMKAKKQKAKENHVVCHQKFQARIHEAEDSMQAQHLIVEALVEEKDSLLQTIQGLQEANNAPAPFDDEWEEDRKNNRKKKRLRIFLWRGRDR
ncbi:D-xylose-proton symporter-like 3, chloroplastic-like [Dorcoceras hygrometricum]|uniref:D-xylose-proton symporter-like 3, chloroplastic-like n=1 Tax=Dorcoceras hygrometricum TaxID=472368 RepID=A0A2Z7A698_9LAMI|nr:D-xylose-proton symporter-like 3, chloroplastic-like [Dorcoceras hygrometricum]